MPKSTVWEKAQPGTLADRIAKLLAQRGPMRSGQIAKLLGVRPENLRIIRRHASLFEHVGWSQFSPYRLTAFGRKAYATQPKSKRQERPSRAKRGPRSLPEDVREILDDRLDAAHVAGTIDLIDDGEDLADCVEITLGEFNRIRAILLREEFEPRRAAARPTNCPPGSAGKVAELARRVEAGEEMAHRLDADPMADDRKGVEVFGSGRAKLVIEVGDELLGDAPSNRGEGIGATFGKPREPRTCREHKDG